VSAPLNSDDLDEAHGIHRSIQRMKSAGRSTIAMAMEGGRRESCGHSTTSLGAASAARHCLVCPSSLLIRSGMSVQGAKARLPRFCLERRLSPVLWRAAFAQAHPRFPLSRSYTTCLLRSPSVSPSSTALRSTSRVMVYASAHEICAWTSSRVTAKGRCGIARGRQRLRELLLNTRECLMEARPGIRPVNAMHVIAAKVLVPARRD
jgi:hypothetical protein